MSTAALPVPPAAAGAPLRIGITGAAGFLGRHLRCFLHGRSGVEVLAVDRAGFADQRLLERLARCDVILHLAGWNRGEGAELAHTNVALAETLVAALGAAASRPHLIYANSIQAGRPTPYGQSKQRAALLLGEWAVGAGARFTNLLLPHLFGEGGRPFYNSVVATFCHQLAAGEEPAILHDGELELLHAQDVALLVWELIQGEHQGEFHPVGRSLRVSGLLELLGGMHALYCRDNVIPDLRDPFHHALFNTLRAALYPRHYPVFPHRHQDRRGWLFEAVKELNGGQTFISTTHPGVTRGNHYHLRKVERFLVLAGEAVLRIRPLLGGEVVSFRLEGAAPAYVDIPTLHTHDLTNVGSGELVTLFWADRIFDPQQPDTVSEEV